MKIKRFYADTMRAALQQVRQEQGPDAVILSNRPVEGGIEVIAAVDYDESLFHQGIQRSRQQSSEQRAAVANGGFYDVVDEPLPQPDEPATEAFDDEPIAIIKESIAAHSPPHEDSRLDELNEELKSLRALMQQELSQLTFNDMQRRRPGIAAVIRRLSRLGLDHDIIESLVSILPSKADDRYAWRTVLALLSKRTPIASEDICLNGGTFALIGPTGVGKTSTIAKIAANYALRHGADSVALVTTDCTSIGAQEQLFRIGKILDIPVQVAANSQALNNTLAALAGKSLILIDTAGCGQRDPRLVQQLAMLTNTAVPIQALLTVSANAQTDCIKEVLRAFGCIELAGVVVTKVDEATSLGGLLSAIISADLAICYVADGQNIPGDLHTAAKYRAELISRAVALTQQYAPEQAEEPLQEKAGLSNYPHQAVING